MMRRLRRLGLVLLGLFAGTAVAQADDFYKGKTITILVGFSPGGGFDINARLLSRHLGRHIPGQPEVVVTNMPVTPKNAAESRKVLDDIYGAPADLVKEARQIAGE